MKNIKNIKIKVNSLYYLLLCLAFLPSGSIFNVPIKSIITIVIIINLALRQSITVKKSTKILLLSMMMTVPWAVLSIVNGYSDGMLSFYKSYFPFLLVVLITFVYADNDLLDYEKALKCLKMAALILLVSKLVLEMLLIFHMIDYSLIGVIYEDILGTLWVGLEIPGGLFRITNANDDLVFVVISLLILTETGSIFKKCFWTILGAFYVVIVFSRVTIVEYLILLIVAFGVYFYINHNKKGLICLGTMATICIAAVVIGISSESIMTVINARFSSNLTTYSDSFRKEQFRYLWMGFKSNPIIGNGLGSYVRQCIRSYSNIHSYELEWMALLYQLGVVGIITIIGTMLYSIYYSVFKGLKNKGVKIYLLAVFAIWLAKPLFNPNMFASHSAIIVSLLVIVSFVYGNKKSVYGGNENWMK